MGPGAPGYIQPVRKWEVKEGVRMFWEERSFLGVASQMHVTWVRETGEEKLEDVWLCVDA